MSGLLSPTTSEAIARDFAALPVWIQREYHFFQSLCAAIPAVGCIRERLDQSIHQFTINSSYVIDGISYTVYAVVVYSVGVLPQVIKGFDTSVFKEHLITLDTNSPPRAIHVIGYRTRDRAFSAYDTMSTRLRTIVLRSTDLTFRRFERDGLITRSLTIGDTRRLVLHPILKGRYVVGQRIYFHTTLGQFCQLGDTESFLLSCKDETLTLYRNINRRGRPRQSDIIFTLPVYDGITWIRQCIIGISDNDLNELIHWLTGLTIKSE